MPPRGLLLTGALSLAATLLACAPPSPPPPAASPAAAAVAVPLLTPAQIAARVERQRLVDAIAALPTKRSPVGGPDHVRGLLQTQELLETKLRALGFEPRLQRVAWRRRGDAADAAPPTWVNLHIELPGQGPFAREVVLVGAHFDAVPNSPGADDNASGVAAALEIARVLKDLPRRRTVRIAFYNLEEIGLVGSTQHALEIGSEIADGSIDLVAMLSLEMLGYFSDEPNSQRTPFKGIRGLPDPEKDDVRGDFLALATTARWTKLARALAAAMHRAEPSLPTLVIDQFPFAPPDLLRSDHGPFLLAGLPGLMVTDTSNFRNPHYHKPSDTLATLDLPRYTAAVGALAAAIHHLAGPADDPNLASPPDLSPTDISPADLSPTEPARREPAPSKNAAPADQPRAPGGSLDHGGRGPSQITLAGQAPGRFARPRRRAWRRGPARTRRRPVRP